MDKIQLLILHEWISYFHKVNDYLKRRILHRFVFQTDFMWIVIIEKV